MALTPDQQAMLQLLLERGQTYADLGELLGGGEDEVRTRARAALTALGGSDPDRNVGLTDYLLGQADPIGRADAVRHLKDNPDDLALATELAQKLQLIAPKARLPRLPGETASAAARGPRPEAQARSPERNISAPQGRLLVALGCGAVLLVVAVLAIAGVFSGGSDENGSTTAGGTAQGGSGCTTTTCGHPVVPLVTRGGDYHNRTALSAFQVPLAQQAQSVTVALDDAAGLTQVLQSAVQAGTPIVDYDGKTVLEGRIHRDPNAETLQAVHLTPPDGGKASGTVVFAQAKDQPYLEFQFKNLPEAPQGQAYVLWFVFPNGENATS
jgi:hypothetical protein